MNLDGLNYEELEEELEIKRTEFKDVTNALNKLKEVLNDLSDVSYDGAAASYNKLQEEYDLIDEIKTGLKIDIEDIEEQMAVLEDTYDDRSEREHEYWASQF